MITSRVTKEEDRARLDYWIAADPDHVGKTTPNFFIPPAENDGVKYFTICDKHGPIFYVRGENILRLHIQFAPESERRRTVLAVDEFTKVIAEGAKANKYKQLIFDSVFEPLISFLEKRGFHRSPAEIVRDL